MSEYVDDVNGRASCSSSDLLLFCLSFLLRLN